jgi:hypothetical protein
LNTIKNVKPKIENNKKSENKLESIEINNKGQAALKFKE